MSDLLRKSKELERRVEGRRGGLLQATRNTSVSLLNRRETLGEFQTLGEFCTTSVCRIDRKGARFLETRGPVTGLLQKLK